MELENSRGKDEYEELQRTLNEMGFHEEGMELQEMRQVLDALQLSANESETNFSDYDMQQALRESELDFQPTQNGRVLNSTMMSTHPNISPCCSPILNSDRFTVQAEVHHPLDWSPSDHSLQRKLFDSGNMANNNITFDLQNVSECFQESLELETFNICDTERSTTQKMVNNSTPNVNALENNLEISNSSFADIGDRVSEHRNQDSGFNMSLERSHTSLNNNFSNIRHSSNSSSKNLGNCLSEVNNSSHEIIGPVSMRRIHDSGVNNSTTTPHDSISYSNENSSYSSGMSTTSAVNQCDSDEPSELLKNLIAKI